MSERLSRLPAQIVAAVLLGLIAWGAGRLHGGAVETATLATRLDGIEQRLDDIRRRLDEGYTLQAAERDHALRDRLVELIRRRQEEIDDRLRRLESRPGG